MCRSERTARQTADIGKRGLHSGPDRRRRHHHTDSTARADTDDDGQINLEEFKSLVRTLDEDISEEELRIGFAETDVGGNGRINIDEFRAWWLSG